MAVHLPSSSIHDPFLGLLAWFLFYLWPWLLDVAFPTDPGFDLRDRIREWFIQQLVPSWIEALNLTSAAQSAAILALLGAGLLMIYNVSALWYQVTRRWRRETLLVASLSFNLFIYSYPWIFAPKDWAAQSYFLAPFYVRRSWIEGFSEYGILWAMPVTIMLSMLTFELYERRKIRTAVPPVDAGHTVQVENESFRKLRDACDLRIGLILSGGGAKGVYQAGAMKAIHEFLNHHGCLDKVRMIAGTSIGSWNSMFWLANLVGADPGKVSPHELWWRTTNVQRIIEFDTYLPFRKNSMLRSKPWRENFDEIFKTSELASILSRQNPIHFYLTRSNVAQGRLEFTTNWTKSERERALQSEDIQVDSFTEPANVDEIREAVFASMDLPPLFPYQKIGSEYFEDGGVIDNLPMRFGTFVEECDLLFVLALNSSFEATPDQYSIIARLARVTDVRQGVLERNSMRMAYLYNHINHLSNSSGTAAVKARKLVRIFAICPDQPLTVGTSEFWKTRNFEDAFHTMYNATRVELSKFNFAVEPGVKTSDRKDWLRMALVSQAGEIKYNYRF